MSPIIRLKGISVISHPGLASFNLNRPQVFAPSTKTPTIALSTASGTVPPQTNTSATGGVVAELPERFIGSKTEEPVLG
ncbi:hypothetical protein HanRHA438_Chr13g0613891 [Helianthus annuus]|nr:hypothetical protein HanRHA438_Chr13g0613891 [Helianthus annuus]